MIIPQIDLSKFSSDDFDRGASRLKEALWVLVRAAFFLPSLPWPGALRVLLLRLFAARVGKSVIIRSRVNIWFPWRLNIGNHVWLGEEVFILNLARVTIESHVCVSQRAFLCTGSHDHRKREFPLITKPIVVHSGCWIASQVFIGPGVEIGPNSVVGVGSIVLKNVPPNVVVRGNPAQIVGARTAD
jgi:putative colanic acid biosynthesis acetyltransferase WcaF